MSLSPPPASSPDNEHLSFPIFPEDSAQETSSPSTSQPRQLLKDRLYIGNLHPSVDEYSLLQLFSKFGKVTKLDFLFHKTGVLKGKPRGYAFIEYATNDEAMKALSLAHDKLFRGRRLSVTFAHQAPLDSGGPSSSKRRSMAETGRPTTLSLLKSGMSSRPERMNDKIAMMEAKLRQIEASKPESIAKSVSLPAPTGLAALPAKPPPPLPAHLANAMNSQAPSRPAQKAQNLPSLPILAPSHSSDSTSTSNLQVASAEPKVKPALTWPAKSKLVGVKITKVKDKPTRPVESTSSMES